MNMASELILRKGQKYFTHNPEEAFQVVNGSVIVFVTVWYSADDPQHAETGQLVALTEATPDNRLAIPSFSYLDSDNLCWRFCLQASEDNTRLLVRQVTKPLKKNFAIEYFGIDTYTRENGQQKGFESCLIAYYHKTLAKQGAIISKSNEVQTDAKAEVITRIQSGLNTSEAIEGSVNDLYSAIQYGALVCKIDGIISKDQLKALYRDRQVTVPDIAQASHFLCREVLLDMNWQKNDCGVIITKRNYKGEENKPEKHYVTCFQKKKTYYCFDGNTGEVQKLTDVGVENLEAKAYVIGRALPQKALERRDIFQFIKKSFKCWEIMAILVWCIVSTIISVLLPKLNQLIYDEYIPIGNTNLVYQICIVIISCMIGNIFISVVKGLLEFRVSTRVGYDFQNATYHRLFELPERFFRQHESGELAQRCQGVGEITNSVVEMIVSNSLSLLVTTIYLVQMIRFSGKLALVGLLMLLIYGILVYCLSITRQKALTKMAEEKGHASGLLYQFISGIEKVRMAGAENQVSLQYMDPVIKEKRLLVKSDRISSFISILFDSGSTLFSIVLYFMMANSNLNMTIGSFIAFNTAFGAVSGSIMGLAQAAVQYNGLKPTIQRLKPIYNEEPEKSIGKDRVTELKGNIDIEHVTFSYDQDQSPVLKNLSLNIRAGEYVALVGASGCGKSTLLKLLLGFENPDSGRISYDGKDLRSIDVRSLRKLLGVVLQNGKLISGSISDNITIASTGTNDQAKLWQTIDDVGLREDIENMPMGIHTVLNETGNSISGGQVQRILIARAIYNNPAILFFDEATSALDNITQKIVTDSLEKRHITRIVIAHRLSTVKNCDRIILLDNGGIAEEGSYEELMMKQGMFYEMALRQLV